MAKHAARNMAGIFNTTDYGTNGPEWGKGTGMYTFPVKTYPQCEGCYGVKFGMGCDRGKVEWMKWRSHRPLPNVLISRKFHVGPYL